MEGNICILFLNGQYFLFYVSGTSLNKLIRQKMPLRQPMGPHDPDIIKTEWCRDPDDPHGDIWRVSTYVSGWKEWNLGLW